MPQEVKALNIKASIDVESPPADLQLWDNQEKILKNTGIERDGGITNLYTSIESNVLYAETLITRNNKRVQLLRDNVNQLFEVFTNGRNIGRVPLWGATDRRVLSVDANDVMATVDGTLLVLRITSALATIQEVDADTLDLIRARSFIIPSDVSDGMFVRYKAPTWSSVVSIAGIFASGTKLNHRIILDSGVVYNIGSQLGFIDSSQVFAYYTNGWIVSANDETDGRTFLLNSAGTQQGTYTEAVYLVANHDRGTGAVTFTGWRDVVILGTPTTYGNRFTPPAAPLGVWTITALTNTVASPQSVDMTAGGYAVSYGTPTKQLYYANNSTTRTWTTNHYTNPEIYGWLDNLADIVVKSHTILGKAAYLSASFNVDGIGCPITEVGELNAFYYPQIIKLSADVYRIMYRRGNGSFATVKITKESDLDRLQEIAPGVVKINTISALCIADSNDNDLQFAGNAYNGFVVVGFDTVSPVQKAFVARYRGDYGGSVDTNYKSTGTSLVGTPNLVVVPESVSFSPNNETIDVYYGPPPASLEYYRSIRDGNAQSVKGNLQGTLYVDDTIIPPPIGVVYSEQTIALIGSTAVREFNYDGYQLLNETPGQYTSFRLYGNLYLFDGDWIHSTQVNVNILQRIDHVVQALGLQFLCESPTATFFYSSFDNSIYTFDGGQAVTKQMRLNQRGPIKGAVYNTRENTLAIELDASVLFVRDGIMSEVMLPFRFPYVAYSTSDGVYFVKDNYAIKYLYNPISGTGTIVISLDIDGGTWGDVYPDTYDGGTWGTVYTDTIDSVVWGGGAGIIQPLVWRSLFNGYSNRMRQNLDRFLFRVYKDDKAETEITFQYFGYREDAQISETETVTVGDLAHPYDSDGYAMIEYIPRDKNSLASSIQLTCGEKIVILDGYATVSTAGNSVAPNRG